MGPSFDRQKHEEANLHTLRSGGLRYEKKQDEAGVGSSHEVLPLRLEALLRERYQAKARQSIESQGFTRYAYEPGDTAHGGVDAHKAQQEEELNEVLRKARANPWHLFSYGLLCRVDSQGNYECANWMMHPLSGYGLHFFLKAFDIGKLQDNYLVEFIQRPEEEDPRDRKPKVDDPDYAEKLAAYNVFLNAKDVYCVIQYVRDDFALLVRCRFRCLWVRCLSLYSEECRQHGGQAKVSGGHLRGTEKASDIRASTLEVQESLLDRVKEWDQSGKPASREELMDAMLHYFLAAGVDEEEIGDFSIDTMPRIQDQHLRMASEFHLDWRKDEGGSPAVAFLSALLLPFGSLVALWSFLHCLQAV
ncbi:unnamed protein product [Symbiodinium sp. CCMP2456]|nr:unnamed protein product [Symbiodinium sp. CCMP2456]